jgi:hypothetical protein
MLVVIVEVNDLFVCLPPLERQEYQTSKIEEIRRYS